MNQTENSVLIIEEFHIVDDITYCIYGIYNESKGYFEATISDDIKPYMECNINLPEESITSFRYLDICASVMKEWRQRH